jgi:hypothetical protein
VKCLLKRPFNKKKRLKVNSIEGNLQFKVGHNSMKENDLNIHILAVFVQKILQKM